MRRTFLSLLLALSGCFSVIAATPHPVRAAAAPPSGGVVLDGYGGIHPFGGVSLNTDGAPYWGWDIARALVLLPDDSGGWVLDGYGGIHNFGAAPPISTPAYWPGWDIARGLAVWDNGRAGYLLDGYGGVHPFGNAPAWPEPHVYWPGWDIARGLDVHVNSSGTVDGGWILDGFGGIHAVGNVPLLASPRWYPNLDVFRKLHVIGNAAYEVARWGIVDRVGSPAGIDWSGEPSWGNWDIVRDVVPVNPSGGWNDQPVSRGAAAALMTALQGYDRAQRGIPGLAENSTLDAIAGNGFSYQLSACGGSNTVIGDRTEDMYNRNVFAHAIAGCSGTQYVFSTYLRTSGLPWSWAGENIAWIGGVSSLLDSAWQSNNNWLNSPSHYANIVNPNYRSAGCGADYVAAGSYQGWNGPTYVWACEFTG